MTIRIIEYSQEHDSIELLYQVGTNDSDVVSMSLRGLKVLLDKAKRGDFGKDDNRAAIVREIMDKGGMTWVHSRIDELVQL
jgi:hypothetical protein